MINYTGSREQEFKSHPFISKSNTKLRIFSLGYDEILCRYKIPNFEEQDEAQKRTKEPQTLPF